jgi:ketosteroid isomerase-like protein
MAEIAYMGEAPTFARWHHADGGKGWPSSARGLGKEKLAMSEQENTGLVQQAYGYFLSGDIPAVLDLLSEDVEWLVPEVEGVPGRGKWHGREQVGQFFQTLDDTEEARQFEPREFVAQDDKVVALGHYVWHVKSNGRE